MKRKLCVNSLTPVIQSRCLINLSLRRKPPADSLLCSLSRIPFKSKTITIAVVICIAIPDKRPPIIHFKAGIEWHVIVIAFVILDPDTIPRFIALVMRIMVSSRYQSLVAISPVEIS